MQNHQLQDMTIHLLGVPFDLGRFDRGLGQGPGRLLDGGTLDRLRSLGYEVSTSWVELDEPVAHEVGAAFAVNSRLAADLKRVRSDGARPLVLAGNCNHALGVIGGLASHDLGVIWFDAHGDFNTPSTTESGFFDGFALNMVVGNSWQAMTSRVPGFHPVPESSVILAGVRDLDPAEADLLRASDVTVLDDSSLEDDLADFERACRMVARRAKKVAVHVDLDVVDRDLAPANRFSPRGGLKPDLLRECLAIVSRTFDVECATLASYEPGVDPDGRALAVGLDVITWLASCVTSRPTHVRAGS